MYTNIYIINIIIIIDIILLLLFPTCQVRVSRFSQRYNSSFVLGHLLLLWIEYQNNRSGWGSFEVK